ncbi:MAG: MucBP domain-containing protein, partial [Streptococcaceae bacterium]|nr:MucBP domain-containing protein [Streptococcaceae bacterium]
MTIQFVDKSGKKLVKDVVIKGNVGNSYDATKRVAVIKGYHLVQAPKAITGKFVKGGSTIKFVYDKDIDRGTLPDTQGTDDHG